LAALKQLLKNIDQTECGPQVAAIFDFDGTIIAGWSATAFVREQVKRGQLSPQGLKDLLAAMVSFSRGSLGFSGLMMVSARSMKGFSEQTYIDIGEHMYHDHIARLIYPEARTLIDAHRAKGHTLAVISSATRYQVTQAAEELGIEHVLCSRFEIENGQFTGGVERPLCFGEGKVVAAQNLASATGAKLDQSFFYSDSHDDLQLLDHVGHPQPLNPNKKLSTIARSRQWDCASFDSRGRPSLNRLVRSMAVTGSMVSSFAAGIPIWALTGSRTKAQNFSLSLFGDTASALIGMDLEVTGEQHLWSQRPAVFVFNHQSKADLVIITKLLRRDISAIGKQEIRKLPVIGKILEMGGVVTIDRANSASAIEAMQPLVDMMKKGGKSVVVAPEGTRTVSTALAPFKKGPFHLAMQAGVPMVPIVIHNAIDVAPKGDFVYRAATVKVDILPPIDTSCWRAASVNKHVADVRRMMQAALGQVSPSVAPEVNQ
jgi:putative phosphoserine phosphatase/1-acylglycerol-3-phosphate O-acyltransferase